MGETVAVKGNRATHLKLCGGSKGQPLVHNTCTYVDITLHMHIVHTIIHMHRVVPVYIDTGGGGRTYSDSVERVQYTGMPNRLTLPPILVSTLFCMKSTEMAKHTVNTTEAIPRFKVVKNCLIHLSLTATLSRCR